MTRIEDLAREIAETHGIDSHTAALDVVRVHVDQIADDADLYNAETQELTDDGADVVRLATAESYAQRLYGTRAAELLDHIEREVAALARAEAAVRTRTVSRDELIRQALGTELRRADIAAAAGVQPARLYQIRDGRR